jgi:hypothetical protein
MLFHRASSSVRHLCMTVTYPAGRDDDSGRFVAKQQFRLKLLERLPMSVVQGGKDVARGREASKGNMSGAVGMTPGALFPF